MMHMMQQYSRPAMRAPLQQGLTPSSPMTYRASMQTANLSRVAPAYIPSAIASVDGNTNPDFGSGGSGGGGDGGGGGGDGGGE
jgi:hypothetical protein